MAINGNLKKVNLIGLSGKKQSGKNLIANIWQLLDLYHQTKDVHKCKETDIQYVKFYLESPKLNPAPNHGSIWVQKSFAYKLKQIVCLLIGCTMEQLEDPIFKEKELGEEWWYWKETSSYSDSFSLYPYSQYKQAPSFPHCTLIKLTPRLLLQEIGTNCFRNIIHPDIWINALYADVTANLSSISNKDDWDGFHYDIEEYSNWLITDVRFKNEAESVLKRDGILIRVNRNKFSKENYEEAVDYLKNNGGINKQYLTGTDVCIEANRRYMQNNNHQSETDLDDYNSFHYVIDNTSSIENLIEKIKEIMIKEKFINE